VANHRNPPPLPLVRSDPSAWPTRLRTGQAASYLNEVHDLPIEGKTMRNWRATERGPACRYLGTLPLYDRTELDRWAEHDALQLESPIRRNRRVAGKAANQAAA
jgi:hypothetical protein